MSSSGSPAMLSVSPRPVNIGPSGLPPLSRFCHHHAMVDRAELVDAIAGFSLFADLTGPQLEGIVHLFEEAVFSEGDKVLSQGLTGSGFYVILDGEAAIVVDGTERARLGRGEFFGEVSSSPARMSRPSSSPIRGSCGGCSRPRPAGCGRRTDGGAERQGRALPAGRLPRTRHRQRTRCAADLVVVARARCGARRHLGRSVAGWHVPPLAVLPTSVVVDQAACAGPAWLAR